MNHDDSGDFRPTRPAQGGPPKPSPPLLPEVPPGNIVVSERWKGSGLIRTLEESFKVTFSKQLSFADFRPCGGVLVLYLPESDYVGGCRAFKQKVAKLFSACANNSSSGGGGNQSAVVVCQRTALTSADYLAVQEFAVVELGLAIIPIADQSQLPQLLSQFAAVTKRPNPFKFGIQSASSNSSSSSSSTDSVHKRLLETMKTIPGLGERGSTSLLEEFGTLQKVSQVSEAELAKVLGNLAVAKIVHQFFNAQRPYK